MSEPGGKAAARDADPYRLAGIRVSEKCLECGADIPDASADRRDEDLIEEAARMAYDFLTFLGGEWERKYGEPVTAQTRDEVTKKLAAALRDAADRMGRA